MLFSSATFIFAFLPAVVLVYFALQRRGDARLAKGWLALASLFFYAYWKLEYLPIIVASMLCNFGAGRALAEATSERRRKVVLIAGIVGNLALLFYYKYTDFFLENISAVSGWHFEPLALLLPLGISFFTFQQVAYLVDSYRGLTKAHGPLEYTLFVAFFPQLIAGPIVHHGEMMPQFDDRRSRRFDIARFTTGITVFVVGLFKKVVIADTLAVTANAGYAPDAQLELLGAWQTTLSYTFQLYFDFSGYSDMAIGAALMLNIELPANFNSPYKATNIQDFWRRWHITLSRWLRDYLYVPMGGNRGGELRTYRNLVLTFLLGGIWHGAGWTFVVWGLIHGAGTVVHRLWQRLGTPMPRALAIVVTFLTVHVAWVFFRATSVEQAWEVLAALFGMRGVGTLPALPFGTLDEQAATLELVAPTAMIAIAAVVSFLFPNSLQLVTETDGRLLQRPSLGRAIFTGALMMIAINYVFVAESNEFLYFNF